MKPKSILPVILVSAYDKATAEEFISELIDNEVTETEREVKSGTPDEPDEGAGRVWRLVNKYYCADVLVRAHGDSDRHHASPAQGARVEAHVAYFTPDECEAEDESVAARAERRECACAASAAVRVAALRAAGEGALGEWAARAHYEPVPLLQPTEGVTRVRDALHAHRWPGLRRLDRAAPALSRPLRDSDESSSCGEEEDEDEGDEVDVERAEQFALALSALGEAGVGAGAAAGELGDAERRERAELLLAAFCRALGERLDR